MTSTASLLSLAPELLCALAEQVTEEDLMQLRLTCKYLGDTLEPQALHTIHFSVQNCNYDRATARLQPLATTKNLLRGLPRSGRHLYIGPLSPKHIPDIGFAVRKPIDNPKTLLAEELMRTYLCDALSALRSLQSVTCVRGQFSVPPSSDEQPDSRWTPAMEDEAWTHEAIMEFLASCPSLHVFEVELTHLKVAVTLDRMQGLREISFTYNYCFHPAEPVKVQTYNNLTKLLASRPASQINQLSVVLTSLHEIFQFFPPEVEPLRLKDLRMRKSLIKLDPLTIRHLRHLTCLHLLDMMIPSKSWKVNLLPCGPGSARAQEVEREDRIRSKMLNDFWLALQSAGIYLKEIKVDSINDGLLGYLTCYTGLIKLGIESFFLPLPESSNPLAKLFFAESLARHVETLEELDVKARDEDLWCFGEHNVSAFSRCMGLKTLSVCVPRINDTGIVKNLLDMMLTHMPLLTELSISHAYNAIVSRRPGSTSSDIFERMIKSLLAYSSPPSTTIAQFPSVIIGTEQFEPSFPSLFPYAEEGESGDESEEDVSTDDDSEPEDVSTDDDSESGDVSTNDDSESEDVSTDDSKSEDVSTDDDSESEE